MTGREREMRTDCYAAQQRKGALDNYTPGP